MMEPAGSRASCCGRCAHYTPEGRRGGHCDQLNVVVKSRWKSCSLATPVFLTPLPTLGSALPRLQPLTLTLADAPTDRQAKSPLALVDVPLQEAALALEMEAG